MYGVELYAAVRLAVVDEGLSHHEASRRFGIDRRTVKKMLSYSAPPGYRRTKPVRRPKLDGFTGIVDAILEADTDPDVPRKQRHTAHRIFERLRDEHGFTGGYTIVKDYVRSRRQSTSSAFVPLHHPPCPCPGRLRRGGGGAAGATREGRLLLPDPAPFQRLVRQGLSPGDDRGLPRRPCQRLRLPRRGCAIGFVRQHDPGGGTDSGRRHASAHVGVHASAFALPVPRPLRPARQG